MIFKELENSEVILKPMLEEDFESLFLVGSDPVIWEQHPDYTRYTRDGFKVYFDKLLANNYPFIIKHKVTNEIIGATSYYQYDSIHNNVAIGYTFIAKKYWGSGINSSIKKLLIDYAFKYVDQIFFHVRDKNFRSQSAIKKLGAVKSREYPSHDDKKSFQFEFVLNRKS